MPVFLSLVLWEALARSTQLDRGRVLMAHWRRTELVVSSLLGMHSKSSEQLLTSMSWRRCVLPHGFSVFFHLKVSWQLISRVSFSAKCAVRCFVGVGECGQTTSSTELFLMKVVWCSSWGNQSFFASNWSILLWGHWKGREIDHSSLQNRHLPPRGEPFLCCQSVASEDGTRHRNRNMY